MEEERDDSYGHVLKYTGLFGGVQGLSILISLVRNKIVAALLGPGGMGLVSLFNSGVAFLSQATNLGIPFSAVRHVSELYDQGADEQLQHFVKIVRGWSLLTALLGMLVCIVAGPLLSNYTFSWGDHTLHFILLSPAVGLLAVTGGETAILKGTRRLRPLAVIQVYSVLLALVIGVPVYAVFGESGIVPVIVLMALSSMLLTIRYSLRLFPLQLRGAHGILGEGMEMVRLGVAFTLAGFFGSGAEIVIRSFLNVTGDLNVVGLYNVGFMMTMTYGGMVFSAMETDYFPRLSSVNHDVQQSNLLVNRQIEVSVLIIGPMLVAMLFATPLLIPLLFTGEFMPVVDMMRFSILGLYMRAMNLPVCYMTLAKGDGLSFLLMEGLYSVFIVVLTIVGYNQWGLTGTGMALLGALVLEFFMAYAYTHLRYHYRPTLQALLLGGVHLLLGVVSLLLAIHLQGWGYWVAGVGMSLLSLLFSLVVLRRKTSLWAKLVQNMKRKFGHG